jgi:DNA-binding NarL/FixJ family response regulator
MIRVLCVEDDPVVRTFLAARLTEEPDIQVVATVSDLTRAVIYLRQDGIDVVLLDYLLQGSEGTQLLQSMRPWQRKPEDGACRPAILFCTGYADEAFEAKARLLGADGVVAKERVSSDLIPAVRAVAEGGRWFRDQALCMSE